MIPQILDTDELFHPLPAVKNPVHNTQNFHQKLFESNKRTITRREIHSFHQNIKDKDIILLNKPFSLLPPLPCASGKVSSSENSLFHQTSQTEEDNKTKFRLSTYAKSYFLKPRKTGKPNVITQTLRRTN